LSLIRKPRGGQDRSQRRPKGKEMETQLSLPGIIPAKPPNPPKLPKPPHPRVAARGRLSPIEKAARAIADVDEREAAGRALWAELEAAKRALFAEKRRMLSVPGCGPCDAINADIAALVQRQNEIFWAYASEARRAAWIEGEPERRLRHWRARWLYSLDTLRFIGVSEQAIAALVDPGPPEPPPADPLDTPAINAAFGRLMRAKTDKAWERAAAKFEALCAEAAS
jgi:hypothetical protein